MTIKPYGIRLIGVLTILGWLLLSHLSVHACSPVQDAFNYTLEDRIDNAEIVLVGTVVGGVVRNSYGDWEILSEAEVSVSQYLKGNGDALVNIQGFGDGADCLSIINMEQDAIFFVDRADDGMLQANYLAVHDATMAVTDEKIDEIIAITGENNAPTAPSIMAQLSRLLNQLMTWVVISGIALLVLCLSMFIQQRRSKNPRKTKPKRG